MPRDLGGVSPTCSFVGSFEPTPNLPRAVGEKTRECKLGKIPTEEREFVKKFFKYIPPEERFQHTIGATKQNKLGFSRKEKRNFQHWKWHSRKLNDPMVTSPQGEKESSGWVHGYPSCDGCCRMNPFLFSNTQSTVAGPPLLEVGRILRKRQIRISKGIKVTWFLLTSLRISAGSLPINLWENLRQGSTHELVGSPKPPCDKLTHTPPLCSGSLCEFQD